MAAAERVEWLKLRQSRLSWITAAVVGVGVPALTAGFIAAARHGPADAPLAIKVNAMLIGEGWSAYLGLLAQVLSVAMLAGAGIVVSWCFGREFTDHTITSLYALPTSRPRIAAAKFTVVSAWSIGVGLVAIAVAFAVAPVLELPPLSADAVGPVMKVLIVTVTGTLLALPLAFLASIARGYLPAVTGLILIVVITQILTVIGVGAWFPYASISLWAGMGGATPATLIQPYHLMLIPLTGAAGVAATLWWWRIMEVA